MLIPLLRSITTALYLLLPSISRTLAATLTSTVTIITTVPAPSASSPPSSYTSDGDFRAAILNSTNVYRSQHNATALSWNASLASYAQNWAARCVFEHSSSPRGENLAAGYSSTTTSISAWADERTHFNFHSPDFSESTGHFSQLVWKATTTTGCGRTQCDGRNGVPGWYVVCEYWPAGNVIGEFDQNVQGKIPRSGVGDGSGSRDGNEVDGGRGGKGASDGRGNFAASGAEASGVGLWEISWLLPWATVLLLG